MEVTTLDTDLLRLGQTLIELIDMGLVEAISFTEEEGQPTRYRLAGRPGDEDEQDDEGEAPARSHAAVSA